MAVTGYTWDPLSDSVLEETDVSGNVRVTYTNEPRPWGPLISEERGGQLFQYHFDTLGSTRAITDHTAAVTDTFQFDAWGMELAHVGTAPTPYTWVGRYGYHRDPAMYGRYTIRRRIYLSSPARWSSEDLANLKTTTSYVSHSTAGEPLRYTGDRLLRSTLQPYMYALNSPTRYYDPSGLDAADDLQEAIDDIVEAIANIPKDIALAQCRAWTATQKKNTKWLEDLPKCPCFLCELGYGDNAGKWTEPEPASQTFHPGADFCIRSIPVFLPPLAPGQQCCYKNYELITGGLGAGTPDHTGPGPGNLNSWKHFLDDVRTYYICKRAERLDLYLEARPPNNANGCEPQVI